MNILLSLCFAMLAGLLMTRIMKLIHLPNVTGYLIAGLIVGPYCFRFVAGENLESLSVLTQIALGFIAFSIGGEFKLQQLKEIGLRAGIITLFESLTAILFVDGALLLWGFDKPIAITLGAISAATAPAATLMVVRQYKAHGTVTKTLLPVVALDDAVALIAFSVSIALAKSFAIGTSMTVKNAVFLPILQILASLGIGLIIGIILSLMMQWFRSRTNRLCLIIAGVLGAVAVSEVLDLSSLLVCMMFSAVLVNLSRDPDTLLDICDRWTPPLFMLFFVISGAQLDFSVIPTVGILGISYLVFRSLGKYMGAFCGATVTGADTNVRKYLGITLLPQAGVAIGLAQVTMTALPIDSAARVRAVVLCATMIYELIGPVLTKIALKKAGEIS